MASYRPFAKDFVCRLADGESLQGKGPQDTVRADVQARLVPEGSFRSSSCSASSSSTFCPLGCHERGQCLRGCSSLGSCQACAIAGLPPCEDVRAEAAKNPEGAEQRAYWQSDPTTIPLTVAQYQECSVPYSVSGAEGEWASSMEGVNQPQSPGAGLLGGYY